MESFSSKPSKLGSLTQSGREKKLNQARTILIVIGAITIIANIAVAAMLLKQAPGNEGAILLATVPFIFLGILFVIFGFLVKKYPVPITITSLVLYIAAWLISALQDPAMLAQGIIIKIIIIVALAGAVKTAIAYEKEKAEAPEMETEA